MVNIGIQTLMLVNDFLDTFKHKTNLNFNVLIVILREEWCLKVSQVEMELDSFPGEYAHL